jgi:membrane protease YdiL (CAAX protease family)
VGTILAVGAGLFAWSKNFFKPFDVSSSVEIEGKSVLKGFLAFIFVELILVRQFLFFIGEVIGIPRLGWSEEAQGWENLLIILAGFLSVLIVYYDLNRKTRLQIFQRTKSPWYKQITVGIESWIIIYPFFLVFNQLIAILILLTFKQSARDQVVIEHFKNLLSQPFLLGLTAFEIVTIVPITEEFLFRGLLQNWLKKQFGNGFLAIGLTSLLFAIFHFSNKQGITNIELLLSLFFLSCFLGFIYEKQHSLWASIGLHGCFNMMSIVFILITA